MADNTERLNLYKKNPETDGNDTFNLKTMINDNWDKIDEKVAMLNEEGQVVNKDGSIAGEVPIPVTGDWNDVTENGIYYGDNTMLNAPRYRGVDVSVSSAATVIVNNDNSPFGNSCMQIALVGSIVGDSREILQVRSRKPYTDEWSPWEGFVNYQDFFNHINNTDNPHRVTSEQITNEYRMNDPNWEPNTEGVFYTTAENNISGQVEPWLASIGLTLAELGNPNSIKIVLFAHGRRFSFIQTASIVTSEADVNPVSQVRGTYTRYYNGSNWSEWHIDLFSVNGKTGVAKLNKEDVGLNNVRNFSTATQEQAESGGNNASYMTPLRTKQAIEALATSEQVNLLKNLPEEDIPLSGYPLGLSTFERSQTISGVDYTYTFNVTKTSDTNGLMEIFTLDSEGGKRRVLYRWDNDNHSWDLGTMVYDQKNKPSKSDVGLGNVQNYSIASQAQAEAGNHISSYMNPAMTRKAIEALATSSLVTYINTIPFDAPGDDYPQGITCMYAGNGWSTALYNAVGAGNVINIATNNQYVSQIYLPKSINSYSEAYVRYFASSQGGTWTEFEAINKVKSVNGKTGTVKIDIEDIEGLKGYHLALMEGSETTIEGMERPRNNIMAIGRNAKASIISGANSTVRSAIAVGDSAEANLNGVGGANFGGASLALGSGAGASGGFATAIGCEAKATSARAMAIGKDAIAHSFGALAIGEAASATSLYATALGNGARSENMSTGVLGGDTSSDTSKWLVPGSFTVNGTKNFEMPHPKPSKRDTHVIRHAAVESPTAGDNLYRFTVTATQDNNVQYIDLPDYFVHLNKDVQIFVTGQGHFGNGYGLLNRETEQLEIHCQLPGAYNVLAIGTRDDEHQSVQDWDIKGVEREIGESWTGETYVFVDDEIISDEEIVGGY